MQFAIQAQTALTFPNAITSYAAAPDNAALNVPALGSLTITAWVKTTGTVSQIILAKRTNAAGAGYELWLQAGKFVVNCTHTNATSSGLPTTTRLINDSKWHHLAFVMDNTTGYKLYVDGILEISKAITSTTGITNTAP